MERKHESNQPKKRYAKQQHDATRDDAAGNDAAGDDAVVDANTYMRADEQHKGQDTAAGVHARINGHDSTAHDDERHTAAATRHGYTKHGAESVLYGRFFKKLYRV